MILMIVIMCLIITHIISMFPAFLLGFNVLGWKLGSNDRLGMWCLTPLSTIFQLFRGGQFNLLAEDTGYWRRIPEYPEKTTTYAIIAHHHQHCEVASRSGEVYSIQHYVIDMPLEFIGNDLIVLIKQSTHICWESLKIKLHNFGWIF